MICEQFKPQIPILGLLLESLEGSDVVMPANMNHSACFCFEKQQFLFRTDVSIA